MAPASWDLPSWFPKPAEAAFFLSAAWDPPLRVKGAPTSRKPTGHADWEGDC
jgi:hypothetical protein